MNMQDRNRHFYLPFLRSVRPVEKGGRGHKHSSVPSLRRFLNNQVGRPWTDVYSDICSTSSQQSPLCDRWLDNWTSKVATNVSVVDGVVSDSCGLPLGRNMFYVDPVSGILELTAQRQRSRHISQRSASC